MLVIAHGSAVMTPGCHLIGVLWAVGALALSLAAASTTEDLSIGSILEVHVGLRCSTLVSTLAAAASAAQCRPRAAAAESTGRPPAHRDMRA